MKQKIVKIPVNLFRMLYTNPPENHVFSRVEVTKKKGSKPFSGISATDGIESFLIVPQNQK